MAVNYRNVFYWTMDFSRRDPVAADADPYSATGT